MSKFSEACAKSLNNLAITHLKGKSGQNNVYILEGQKTIATSDYDGKIANFIADVNRLDPSISTSALRVLQSMIVAHLGIKECYDVSTRTRDDFFDDLDMTNYYVDREDVGGSFVYNLFLQVGDDSIYQCSAPSGSAAHLVFYGFIKAKEGLEYFDMCLHEHNTKYLLADDLQSGCYVFHWAEGGRSEGVVFYNSEGHPCIVCSNWTCDEGSEAHKTYKPGERTNIIKVESMRLT